MTEYWEEQMGLHDLSETQRAIARDGYREGVADGLRLAATICEEMGVSDECAEALRELIAVNPAVPLPAPAE